MSAQDLESLYDEALENVRNDRKLAREFLNEVANEIAKDSTQNKYLSPVAAKHVETLQRSNEQLVKVSALLQKREQQSEDFSIDREEIFDMINSTNKADDQKESE